MTGRPTELAELTRWLACGSIVVLVHVAAATLVANWSDPVASAVPAGAITIDLAPLVTSTAEARDDLAPGPPMQEAPPVPEKRETKVDDTPEDAQPTQQNDVTEEKVETIPADAAKAEPAPAVDKAEVTVPAPPPKLVHHRDKPKPARPPAPATTAPARTTHIAVRIAAPAQGQMSGSANAPPSWKGQIVAAIERNKRYPPDAETKREQGTPSVSFTIDRHGRLLSSRLLRGSGVASLDQEAVAILRRAQPFPPAPADIAGTQFNFTIPIRFTAR